MIPFIASIRTDCVCIKACSSAWLYMRNQVEKIWGLVFAFFQTIFPCLFAKKPETLPIPNAIDPSLSLKDKLAFFQGLPESDEEYLRKVVDLHKAILRGEDTEMPIDARHKVREFTRQLNECHPDVFEILLRLSIKIFIYQQWRYSWVTIPMFLKKNFDHYPQMRDLRRVFLKLQTPDQEKIFNFIYVSDIDCFPLPPEGKKLLREVAAMANDLVQGNRPFEEAVQALHKI